MENKKTASLTHWLGDSIERLGRQLQKAGAVKLGGAVYSAGNKLEHFRDSKKTEKQ